MAALTTHRYNSPGPYRRAVQSYFPAAGKKRKVLLWRSRRFRDLLYPEWISPDMGRAGYYRQSTRCLVALCIDVPVCVQPAGHRFLAEVISAQMTIINRYLALQIVMGLGIATAVLLPLFGFLDLLDQLDDVGKGTYQVKDAFLHTALLLPRRFIQLAPFIVLLGNVIALGRLAVGSELTALRVAGLSPTRISLAPLAVGL